MPGTGTTLPVIIWYNFACEELTVKKEVNPVITHINIITNHDNTGWGGVGLGGRKRHFSKKKQPEQNSET